MTKPSASIASPEEVDRAELAEEIRRRDDVPFDELAQLARRIEALDDEPDVRIVYVGNVTFSSLPTYTTVHSFRYGILTESRVAPFGQHMQQVLDPALLPQYDPDVVFLLLSVRGLFPEDVSRVAGMAVDERRSLVERVLDEIDQWISAAKANLSSSILVANFSPPAFPVFGTADLKEEMGETELYMRLNLSLLERYRSDSRVHLVDLAGGLQRFGMERAADERMWYLARIPWREAFLASLGEELSRHVFALSGRTRKCVVLDLDNTVWGGVVGEDGPDGIRIGTGDPESEAYLAAQREILNLKERGILLAVASKNNPVDVEEAFRRRPEMPLSLDDFAAREIHWEPKHTSLEKIAADLNIGTDSLVFVDDNPAEIELVRMMMPGVETFQVPDERSSYAGGLRRLPWFEKAVILTEDREKADQYRANERRERLRSDAPDLTEYLESLETRARIRDAEAADLPRLHQLFTKTNQFNLTTIRYGLGELEDTLDGGSTFLVVAEATDRFGDLGKIGAYLLRRTATDWTVDSFLMSCRAMGRGIETAMMNDLKRRVLEAGEPAPIHATYRPTRKNPPVASFFDNEGFQLLEESDGGEKHYVLEAGEITLHPCDWIEVEP